MAPNAGSERGACARSHKGAGDTWSGSRSALIVPLRAGNWTRWDPPEGRGAPRCETQRRETWEGTLDPTNLSTKRRWIADLARQRPGTALFSLHHLLDPDWMLEAYRLTRKDGTPGIDGVTAAQYEAQLEAHLLDLLERIRSGRYKAPPVRRTYIPKADGSRRPLGIPTFEDKVAQRARTRWRSGPWPWCWSQSTSRTSTTARSASGQGARRTRRCTMCAAR